MARKTVQRTAIQRVFEENEHPLGVQDVLQQAQAYVPRLGIATVYRNLKMLVEENWLQIVELPGESNRYERFGLEHHHHFSCQGCQRVFDLHSCPKNLSSLLPEGFVLSRHEITLYGQCSSCSSSSDSELLG